MRRSFVSVGLTVLIGLSAVPAQAQTPVPAAQTPAAPAVDPYKFEGPLGAILAGVKPDKVADFESGYQEVLKALAASEKPENKALAAAVQIFKVNVTLAETAPRLYFIAITNPPKGASYDLAQLVYYSGAIATREAQDLVFNKIVSSVSSLNPWPLAKIGG